MDFSDYEKCCVCNQPPTVDLSWNEVWCRQCSPNERFAGMSLRTAVVRWNLAQREGRQGKSKS